MPTTLDIASQSSAGVLVTFPFDPTIAADGNEVLFSSSDGKALLKDETSLQLVVVSTNAAGAEANSSVDTPSLAASGSAVGFSSVAKNLGNPAGNRTVYVKNLVTGGILIASETAGAIIGNNINDYEQVSADGTIVAFRSNASNLVAGMTGSQILVKNLVTGSLVVASQTGDNIESNGSIIRSGSISASGDVITFDTNATSLGSAGGNQVYAKTLSTGALVIASRTQAGVIANKSSYTGSVSADGRLVAFVSAATNLVAGTAGNSEIYLKDLVTGALTMISTSATGAFANGYCNDGLLSADGLYVTFESTATNLVSTPVPAGVTQIYVKNLKTGAVALLSKTQAGVAGNADSYLSGEKTPNPAAVMSADDTRVVFMTNATNLGAPNGAPILRATTTVPVLTLGPVAGDNLVSAAEAASVVSIGGLSDQVGGTVTVTLDGAALGGATVASDGSWSVGASLGALAQGGHTLAATVQGDSYLSSTRTGTFTLDTVAPTVAIATPGAFTNQPGQVVAGTGESGTVVTLVDTGVALAQARVAADGTWSAAIGLAGDGLHNLVAQDVDAAGNVGQSAPIAFDLDATPPVLGFDPTPSFSSPTTVTMTGTLFDANGVTAVEMLENGLDLGPATLNGDGTFSFTHDFAPGFHNGLVAQVTDSFANVALVPTDFDVTTGITRAPYAASLDNYSPSGTFLGQTEFTPNGSTYLQYFYTVAPDGHETYDYEAGSFFKKLKYLAFQDIFTASGDIGTETFANKNGTHDTTLYANGEVAAAQGYDRFTGVRKNETFVFDPGFGTDTVSEFRVAGTGHDTLDLPTASLATVAQVLAHTKDGANGAVINLGGGDTITVVGITKAELQANKHDFAFHA